MKQHLKWSPILSPLYYILTQQEDLICLVRAAAVAQDTSLKVLQFFCIIFKKSTATIKVMAACGD